MHVIVLKCICVCACVCVVCVCVCMFVSTCLQLPLIGSKTAMIIGLVIAGVSYLSLGYNNMLIMVPLVIKI